MLSYQKEIYKKAIKDLVIQGHARPEFDPYNEDSLFLFEGDSFILYSLCDAYVNIDFIHVVKKDRKKGISKKLKESLYSIINNKTSWPKRVRADILLCNDASLASFSDYKQRSVTVEKYIEEK